jgi:hypothetical protein
MQGLEEIQDLILDQVLNHSEQEMNLQNQQ